MTDTPLMADTYVLVTRGTGGIGKATVARLAALGVRVGITGRDQGRAAAAAADIRAATGNHAVDIFAVGTSPPMPRAHLRAQPPRAVLAASLLLDRLTASTPARVVAVSSSAH